MLDLETQSVREHWLAVAPGLGPVFDQIERVEDWTVDNLPAIAARVVAFGKALSVPGGAERLERADPAQLLFVLVHMSTARALLIIQWLDDQHDGLGTRLVQSLLQNNGEVVYAGVPHQTLANALVSRLLLINNTPFFAAAFAPARLRAIGKSIKQYAQEKQDA